MKHFLSILSLLFLSNLLTAQEVDFAFDIGNSTTIIQSETGYKIALDAAENTYVTGTFYGTMVNFDPNGTNNKSSNGGSDVFVAKYNSTGGLEWVVTFGGTGDDTGFDIETDGTDVFVTGTLNEGDGSAINVNGTSLTPKGSYDFFLAKFAASNGATGFALNTGAGLTTGQPFEIPGVASGTALVLNGSNVYAVGVASYSFFPPTTYHSYDFDANAVAITDTIMPTAPANLDANNFFDMFIVSYSKSDGSFNWVESIGGKFEDRALDITTDGTDLYVTGAISSTVNFDTDGSGARNVTVNSTDNKDIFIAKFTTTGLDTWAYSMGSNSTDEASSFVGEVGTSITSDGTNVFVTGNYRGTVDFDAKNGTGQNATNAGGDDIFIASYDAAGTYRWSHGIGGTGNDYGNSITLGGSGTALNVFVAGQFQSAVDFDPVGTNVLTSAGSDDIFMAEFSTTGSHVGSQNIGSSGEDIALGIAVNTPATADTRGIPYLTGYFESTVDFDHGANTVNLTTTSAMDKDIFIAKFTTSTLPVELISFEARNLESQVELTWETAIELNNEGFEVYKSNDSKNWEYIGFRLGAGTTQEGQHYSFVDEIPQEGINYYRLKQMDFDGGFVYTDVVSIFNDKRTSTNPLKIFPNPVQSDLTVVNGQGRMTIFNQLGQPLNQFVISENHQAFDLSHLPKGNYIIQVEHRNGLKEMQRFVK
jgi:hypothetical protein